MAQDTSLLMPVMVRPFWSCSMKQAAPTPCRAKRPSSNSQYFLLPLRAFSSIATSHDVIDVRAGAQFRLTAHGEMGIEEFPNLRVGILHVAKYQSFRLLHGLHARRHEALGQPVGAEGALLHHPFAAHGISGIRWLLVFEVGGWRILVVEASCPEGTAGHAVTATDAAVLIHHDEAVIPLPGGLGGTDPDAGRVGAVVAEQEERLLLQFLGQVEVLLTGERMLVVVGPEPLDLLLLVVVRRYVVELMAGLDGLLGGLCVQLRHIYHHRPLLGGESLGMGRERSRSRLHLPKPIEDWQSPQSQRGDSGHLQEASSAALHHFFSLG